jgi:thiamine biosynthesis lipoprotein
MRRVLVPLHVPALVPHVRRKAQIVSLEGQQMGTTWTVTVAAAADIAAGIVERQIGRTVDECLACVIAQMSQWEPSSDLSRFNRAEAGRWQALPEDFFFVLKQALDLARETDGAYDPTVGALTELWGFGASGRRDDMPDVCDIKNARARIGWRRLAIDSQRRAILQPGGVKLDLSSIAKGFAVDLVSETLTKLGLRDHLVEIGGELRGSGFKPDYSPWWVAIGGSDGPPDDTIVALHGLSVATSGDANRFITWQGRRYSHTIDPRTGYPITDRLASVTVFDHSCMRADALATVLSVLGKEDGFQFACERNIAAKFELRVANGTEDRMTPAFSAMMH